MSEFKHLKKSELKKLIKEHGLTVPNSRKTTMIKALNDFFHPPEIDITSSDIDPMHENIPPAPDISKENSHLNFRSLTNAELKILIQEKGLTVKNTKRKTMILELEKAHEPEENIEAIDFPPFHESLVRVCDYESIPVFDQEDIGVCVACAFTSMHQIVRQKIFEPQDLYTAEIQNKGALLAQCGQTLSSKGQRVRKTFENRKNVEDQYVKLATKRAYSKWTFDCLDELKENISNGYPVIVSLTGIEPDRYEYDLSKDNVEHCERGSGQLHAVVATGYIEDDDGSVTIEFLNSYGRGFGWSGFGRMSASFFMQKCEDMTVITKKQKEKLDLDRGYDLEDHVIASI